MRTATRAAVRIVGVIPARMNSERLPGKVLRALGGRAMLHHVYERARGCALLSELWVATDSEEILEYCSRNQIPALMTATTHRSGTERIHEVLQKIPAEIYANIQGDEPMITPGHLDLLLSPFLGDQSIQVTTLKTSLDPVAAANPNVVKVVTNLRGEALYFSRSPIPYHRNPTIPVRFYKHLGLYAYRQQALLRYFQLPPSALEQTERLEQMRFLENGIPICVSETPEDTIGVDTEEDWQAVVRYFENAPPRG